MNRKRIRASRQDSDGNLWTITWEGGAYADLVNPYGKAVDVLNFWDYAKDTPLETSPKNAHELEKRLAEWLEESDAWLDQY
jgi:hypothetical protein